jgi:hypothetical protein
MTMKPTLPIPKPEQVANVLDWAAKFLETYGWTPYPNRSLKGGGDVLQALNEAVTSNYSRGLWFTSRNAICDFLNTDCIAEWNDKQTDPKLVIHMLKSVSQSYERSKRV